MNVCSVIIFYKRFYATHVQRLTHAQKTPRKTPEKKYCDENALKINIINKPDLTLTRMNYRTLKMLGYHSKYLPRSLKIPKTITKGCDITRPGVLVGFLFSIEIYCLNIKVVVIFIEIVHQTFNNRINLQVLVFNFVIPHGTRHRSALADKFGWLRLLRGFSILDTV